MKNSGIVIIFLGLVFLIFSCEEKEPEFHFPEIEVLAPAAFSDYNVLDTVWVKLRVISESPPVNLFISMQNEKYIQVLPTEIFPNIQLDSELLVPFILKDSTMAGGVYSIRINAKSPDGSASRYVNIYINAQPRELKSVWLVSKLSDTKLKISVLNENLDQIQTFNYQGNYAGSDISSTNQQFAIAGANFGDLIVYSASDYETVWEVPIISNPVQPYFTSVEFSNEVLYVGFWDGFIKGYHNAGATLLTTSNNGSTIPCMIQPAGKYLVSAAKQRSNVNAWWMNVNHIEGGSIVTQQYLDHSPVILGLTYEEDILFYSNDANGLISIFLSDPETGIISTPWFPYVLPAEKLICGKDIGKEQVILATENGVYVCKHHSYLAKINEMSEINIIEFEELSQTIFAISGKNITQMDFQGNIISQLPQENNILNIHFLYSK